MTPSSTLLTRAIRALAGTAAVLAILLMGIAIGLYSTAYLGADSLPDHAAGNGKAAAQNREEGLTNPIMRLDPDGREETRRSAPPPCKPQDAAGSTPGKCGSQPSIQNSQKLLVLLTLWRIRS
ncbi:MAG: hypothetical protein PHX38_10315 [Sulfuricella sp.]|nr:hypothetical protein [Sulfuricella sp.]